MKFKEIVKESGKAIVFVSVVATFLMGISFVFGHGLWRNNNTPERFVGGWAFAREGRNSHMSEAFYGLMLSEIHFFEDGTGLEIFDDGSQREIVWAATPWDSRRTITVPQVGFRERDGEPLGGRRYSIELNNYFGNRLTLRGAVTPRSRIAVHRGEEALLFWEGHFTRMR